MQPVIVFPIHDSDGSTFRYLQAITPQLKELFARALVSISPTTEQAQSQNVGQLRQDTFFQLTFNSPDSQIGDQFLAVYRDAAATCPPDQVLHLCFPDRVAFALNSEYKNQFVADVQAVEPARTPLLFQRSEAAWRTHPRNYSETEHMVMRVGELVLGKTIDWTWCHLTIQARQLVEILPHVRRHDMVVLGEIVFGLQDQLKTQDVDWLAWEDPYICNRDAAELRRERENSVAENRKRLGYTIPFMQFLFAATKERDPKGLRDPSGLGSQLNV